MFLQIFLLPSFSTAFPGPLCPCSKLFGGITVSLSGQENLWSDSRPSVALLVSRKDLMDNLSQLSYGTWRGEGREEC